MTGTDPERLIAAYLFDAEERLASARRFKREKPAGMVQIDNWIAAIELEIEAIEVSIEAWKSSKSNEAEYHEFMAKS